MYTCLLVTARFVCGAPLFGGWDVEHWNVPVDSLFHVEERPRGLLCREWLLSGSDDNHELLRRGVGDKEEVRPVHVRPPHHLSFLVVRCDKLTVEDAYALTVGSGLSLFLRR